MKISIAALALASLISLPVYGQIKQTDCERDADAKLNEMISVSSAAGSATYRKIMERVMSCMQGGQCSKPEVLVRIQEIMVDEQIIELQRKKVAIMKEFASRAGPTASACAVASLLPPLIEQLTALNAQQLLRYEAMAAQYYPLRNIR
jgi:hypothetical protein